MAALRFSARARDDLLRLADFLRERGDASADSIGPVIVDGLRTLERHPFAGRNADHPPLREFVVSRGESGYVVLYAVPEPGEFVVVLAVRHQRESGFP